MKQDSLIAIVGDELRAKLLRLFAYHKDDVFLAEDIVKATGSKKEKVDKDVAHP